ncbi:MAG: cytochrome c oxidase subunit II [Pseudomonadota bacterium]|nr:cytochrome c oxidase subunit II [Pseudomonadota bacterium]
MVIAIGLILVAVGTVWFHFYAPLLGWWWTPIASNWEYIDTTIIITFWITGVVFIVLILFMAYCCIRFGYKKGHKSQYKPENPKLEWWLTILTSLGVAGMLTPGLIVWDEFVTVPKNATEIEVVGAQWDWKYRLPGKDGKLGTTNVKLINDNNPFGIELKDKNGRDDVLIEGGDLHLPMDRPVKVLLRSIDVLHDFYVPEFRAKMDMVPGMITYFWITPTRTGKFDVLCFELCGVGHHAMRSSVVVQNKKDYTKWLQEQTTFSKELAKVRADKMVISKLGNQGELKE